MPNVLFSSCRGGTPADEEGARSTTWVPSPMSLSRSDRGLWRFVASGVPAGVGGAPTQVRGHE